MSLTKADLDILRKPFDEKTICVKKQSRSKDKNKISLVLYLQHTDVYSRIEEVDPAWSSEITGEQYFPAPEPKDDWFNIRARLTIKGVSRENAGEGSDKKSATSDAIKRAAMLFGVGRYLYDTEPVWVPYNEDTDYYKTFGIAEYMAALRPGQVRPPIGNSTGSPQNTDAQNGAAANHAPTPAGKKPMIGATDGRVRAQLGTQILEAGRSLNMNGNQVAEYVQAQTGKTTIQLSVAEMQKVLESLQYEIGRNGA